MEAAGLAIGVVGLVAQLASGFVLIKERLQATEGIPDDLSTLFNDVQRVAKMFDDIIAQNKLLLQHETFGERFEELIQDLRTLSLSIRDYLPRKKTSSPLWKYKAAATKLDQFRKDLQRMKDKLNSSISEFQTWLQAVELQTLQGIHQRLSDRDLRDSVGNLRTELPKCWVCDKKYTFGRYFSISDCRHPLCKECRDVYEPKFKRDHEAGSDKCSLCPRRAKRRYSSVEAYWSFSSSSSESGASSIRRRPERQYSAPVSGHSHPDSDRKTEKSYRDSTRNLQNLPYTGLPTPAQSPLRFTPKPLNLNEGLDFPWKASTPSKNTSTIILPTSQTPLEAANGTRWEAPCPTCYRIMYGVIQADGPWRIMSAKCANGCGTFRAVPAGT